MGGEIVEGDVDIDPMGRSRQPHEMLIRLPLNAVQMTTFDSFSNVMFIIFYLLYLSCFFASWSQLVVLTIGHIDV